jgi:vacuolar-type H+-ATPase subunit I/STV1
MNLMELILTEQEILDEYGEYAHCLGIENYLFNLIKHFNKSQIAKLQPVFDAQEAEIKKLKRQLMDVEEREAGVCPEDIGFDDYIKQLKRQLDTLKQENEGLRNQLKGGDNQKSGESEYPHGFGF